MKKKIIIIIGIILLVLIIIFTSKIITKQKNEIPDGYIAVFHGGVGEQTYETYIYKKNNGNANYGFDYINVTSTTVSWGSSEWNSKITKSGSVQWTDDVFTVAKENGADSFVTLPNSDKIYTIEEFMHMFLMN